MAWRVAKSLDKLLAQINAYAPNRSKISDGSIGDTAHSSRVSDHNPDSRGVVHARDFTHSPATGFDAHAFARRLAKAGDRRIKYLISNRQISNPSISAGRWRPYSGINGHTQHAHVSCVYGALEDNTATWPGLGAAGGVVIAPSAPAKPEGFFGMTVYNKGSYNPNLTLTPGKWKQIPIGKGAYSIATVKKGAETFTVLTFRFEGLPKGAEVQVRFMELDYKKGANKVHARFPVTEIVGTGGQTFGQAVFLRKTAANPGRGYSLRIRAEICTFEKGVKLTRVNTTVAKG